LHPFCCWHPCYSGVPAVTNIPDVANIADVVVNPAVAVDSGLAAVFNHLLYWYRVASIGTEGRLYWYRGVMVLLPGLVTWNLKYIVHANLPLGQLASVRTTDSHWGENGTIRLLTLTLTQTHQFCPMQKQAPSPHQADTHQARSQAKNCMYYCMCSTEYHHQYCM
jgi:hypothetical protein